MITVAAFLAAWFVLSVAVGMAVGRYLRASR